MTVEEMAAKACSALKAEGHQAEMLVILPRRWGTQRRMRVLPGVYGRPISEAEGRGTVVYVRAADVLAALVKGGLVALGAADGGPCDKRAKAETQTKRRDRSTC